MIPPTSWRDDALLLVGHGSSRVASSRAATLRLADSLRGRGIFAEVAACFWKEEPFLSLDLVSAPTVHVVPNFAGIGVFTGKLIPERLGLTGTLSLIDGRRVLYSRPIGSHPLIPALLRRRAEAVCADAVIAPQETALLIVGHGSSRPGGSSVTPEQVAADIRRNGRFAEVATAYMEQAPRVADWPGLVQSRKVVVAPLLISEGTHASRDLPPLFGLDRAEGGPSRLLGREVWLMSGVGTDDELAEITLDLVGAAQAEAADAWTRRA